MRWFANDFHSWLRHSWKSLANHLTRDQKIVIHGNSCIILYIYKSLVVRCRTYSKHTANMFCNGQHKKYKQVHSSICYLSSTAHIIYRWLSAILLMHWRYCSLALSKRYTVSFCASIYSLGWQPSSGTKSCCLALNKLANTHFIYFLEWYQNGWWDHMKYCGT